MFDHWAEEQQKPISVVLRELCAEDDMRLGYIVDRFGRRALGSLLFVLAIPNLLPLPPGSSTVLGAPLLLLSPQLALGVHAPWLPNWLENRTISGADLSRAFNRLLPWVERIEKISRPRLGFMFGTVGDRAIGVICSLLSFVLILPIPLGNLLPALTIGVLGFALLQRDGLFATAGYILAAFSGLLLYLAADTVVAGVRLLVNWFGGA